MSRGRSRGAPAVGLPSVEAKGLAIGELLSPVPPTPERIERFLNGHTFPLVEGPLCTFVYRGKAREVRLRHWVYGLRTATAFERIPRTDLWYHVLELPYGSRVEYKLEVTTRGGTELIEDPLNPRRARDPFGANSVCHAFGYEVPPWTQPDPDAPEGSVEERVYDSRALRGRRHLRLYRPAAFETAGPCPLMVVHDGRDYLDYAGLKTVLDNLIHRREIPPLVAALMHPPDRMAQYRDQGEHATYLAEELVPSLEEELSLAARPDGRCVMGASLGAVASFSTALRHPGYFGRLLLQSGSFVFGEPEDHERGADFYPIAEMVNRFRDRPTKVSDRVFVSCGLYESLIHENRQLVPVLESAGMDVKYVEAPDGHNWENWRDRLRDALTFLFPGPAAPDTEEPTTTTQGDSDG